MTDALSSTSPLGDPAVGRGAAQGPEAVTVVAEVRAKPERQGAFLIELLATTAQWAGEPGCLNVTVLRDSADPARFVVLETFASAQALQLHETLPSTREFLGRVQQHLAAPPSRTTCQLASQPGPA